MVLTNIGKNGVAKATPCENVGLLGIEPRLFWTKTRRVASYTIGHERSKCTRKFFLLQLFDKNYISKVMIYFA